MKIKTKIVIAILFLFTPAYALAWDDCPSGEVNSTEAGCGLYEDTDNNGICDHSELAPEDRSSEGELELSEDITSSSSVSTEDHEDLMDLISGGDLKKKTVGEIAILYGIDSHEFKAELEKEFGFEDVHCGTSFGDLHKEYKYSPSEVKALAVALAKGEEYLSYQERMAEDTSIDDKSSEESNIDTVEREKSLMDEYYSTLLIILTLGGYGLTWILARNKKIKLITHRKIWNAILLVSFLVSGLLGLLLAIIIDQKAIIDWYREILWLHVEFGIIMAVISVFHAAWHWKYFTKIIKRKKK